VAHAPVPLRDIVKQGLVSEGLITELREILRLFMILDHIHPWNKLNNIVAKRTRKLLRFVLRYGVASNAKAGIQVLGRAEPIMAIARLTLLTILNPLMKASAGVPLESKTVVRCRRVLKPEFELIRAIVLNSLVDNLGHLMR
jgi:hypothetical protein